MSTLTDVADLLLDEGLITIDDYKVSEIPDEPLEVVVLHETPGPAPAFVHGHIGPAYEYPRLRIVVRSDEYDQAYDRSFAIYKLLGSVVNLDINGVRYLRISPMGSPAQAQRDGNDNVLMMCDYQVSRATPNV
jgi:hypothetical protein